MSEGTHSEGHSHTRSAAGVPSLDPGSPARPVDRLYEGHQMRLAGYSERLLYH